MATGLVSKGRRRDVVNEAEIIARYGLDAFLFLRYLQTLLKIFIPLAVIILPVLIPVNLIHGIGARGGVYGLDRISWANVDRRHTARYWAHWCIAQVVVVWVCHVLWYEIQSYARIRHRRLLSVKRFENACGTTVLVTDIPRNLRNAEDLRLLYNVYPGGIRSLKINRDFRKLKRKIRERDQAVQQLESAETRLILQAQKANASSSCSQEKLKRLSEENRATRTLPACGILWFPPLPFVSEKVDMINFYRTRVAALNEEIRKEQADPVIFAETSSAIITFNRPLGAQLAAQSILHPQPHQMVATLVEDPSQVVWENVSMSWWERSTRSCLLGCISAWAIVACIVPVAFTGLLSQLGYTMTLFPWLSWLERVPSWVLSAVQGVLPPAMLATVTVLVPTVLQWLILAQGRNSFATAELVLQDYYFSFLFLQVFVVVSTSSSVATVLGSLEHEVSSVAALVAQNLPKAANYFFSYLILQALSVSSGSLLQVGRLVQFLSARVFHKTGRQLWEKIKKPEIRWGTFFPFYSNLAVITLIYTVVSPLILVLAILTFGSFLAVQRYNILHVASFNTDTGGLIYFKALNQLFVGLYIMELYLVGLFFLVRDKDGQVACIGQGVAMVVSTGLTAAFQVALSQAYKPLITTVPVMLSSGTSGNVSSDGKVEPRGHNPAWVYTVQKRVNRLHQLINRFVEEEVSPLKDFEEAEALVSRAEVREIEDSALIAEQPEVWLPRDEIGMSRYEIQQTQGFSSRINISDELFVLDKKGNIHYHGQGKYTNCAKLT
ncbi:MAG: hypothetical protein LQ342_008383 [Letrouitia transgressa]|nr:MAG: hypothetical protein LQ342_008383 [Letrouitia transgressa]